MLIELHNNPIAKLITEHGIIYGDFLTTSYEPTQKFVSLHKIAKNSNFNNLILEALKDPKAMEVSQRYCDMSGVPLFNVVDKIFGLSWAPQTIIIGMNLSNSIKKPFGYLNFRRDFPVTTDLIVEDINCCPILSGEKILIIDDVCVTGRGLNQVCQQVAERGALPVPLIVVNRGSEERISTTLGGQDAISLCNYEDIGITLTPSSGIIDQKIIKEQWDRLKVEGWL